jgi:Zn-dependent protease with chaperone function
MDSVRSADVASASGPQIAFVGSISPARRSALYQCGLAVVALAMLLLPMLYLGMIVLAGAAAWWHLTENAWILNTLGVNIVGLFGFVAPPFIAVVLAFFMIKPVLARPAKRREPVRVLPESEPILFSFIEQICRHLRAPVPRQVRVDCQVNASASFMAGRFGPFSNDLALTIGLPLVADLSIRELGGVLAHELGHFAQGGGMRLTAVVRGINGWFARVVYERDQWDEKLDQWTRETDRTYPPTIVLWPAARGSIWISRRVLSGLMMAGNAISCFMMRQMEYDADSCAINVAGSAAFARTSTRMMELGLAAQFVEIDLREGWQRRTLPSNLPACVVKRSKGLSDELVASARPLTETPTRIFDMHPADPERLRAAAAAEAPGIIVGGDGPAIALFRNFDALCTAATRHLYEHGLGLCLEGATLLETERVAQETHDREKRHEAIKQFFGGRISIDRPLRIAIADLEPLSAEELRILCRSARDRMAAMHAALADQYRSFEVLQHKQELAFSALEVLSAGFSIARPADFGLTEGGLDVVMATQASVMKEQQALAPVLDAFEQVAARRLSGCLCLLRQLPHSVRQAESQEASFLAPQTTTDESVSLINAFEALAGVMSHVQNLRQLVAAGSVLVSQWSGNNPPDQLRARIDLVTVRIWRCVEQLLIGLKDIPCPAAFANEPMTLATRCGLSLDAATIDPRDIVERASTLYFGVLGRLVSIVQAVEATLESHDQLA